MISPRTYSFFGENGKLSWLQTKLHKLPCCIPLQASTFPLENQVFTSENELLILHVKNQWKTIGDQILKKSLINLKDSFLALDYDLFFLTWACTLNSLANVVSYKFLHYGAELLSQKNRFSHVLH